MIVKMLRKIFLHTDQVWKEMYINENDGETMTTCNENKSTH